MDNKEYYQKNRKKLIEFQKRYYQLNKEKVLLYHKKYCIENKDIIFDRNKNYRNSHRAELLKKKKDYYYKNRDKFLKLFKLYKKNNKEKVNKMIRDLRQNNINVRILHILRRRLNHAIKNNTKSTRTIKLLGCSIEKLKEHLQKQFWPGMSWENYGKWHIDHKRPCASFDLSKAEEQARCFNYMNLQPLWAKDNLEKGSKIMI